MKGINAYKKNKSSSFSGMSQYNLVMRLYKEVESNLTECKVLFSDKGAAGSLSDFYNEKSRLLSKASSIIVYLIETNKNDNDPEVVDLFNKMYHYILHNVIEANKGMEIEPLDRGLLMTRELIDIWESIPDRDRN